MKQLHAVVIGLTALIIAAGQFFYFDITPKLVVLLAGAALCALTWRGTRPGRPFTLVVAASALWLIIASAVSTNAALSFYGSTWRRFGVVAQLAVLLLAWLIAQNGATGRTVVLRGMVYASTLAAAYGISQYFGWDPLLPKSTYHIGEGIWTIVRPPGTMGYVSYFATLLLTGGLLGLALARSEESVVMRRLAYGCVALCFVAMALTGTRAALLGLLAGAATAAWMRGFRPSRRAAAALAMLALAVTAFYFSPLGWNLRSRARWFREDPWGGARPLLWRDSFFMAMARPLTGFGPEVFTGAFPQYESRELARAYPDFAHESPHNIFLDALVSEGMPGLACLMILCALAIRGAVGRKEHWLGAALVAAIVAQQFTVFTIPTALVFFAVIALCVAREPEPAGHLAWPARVPAVAIAAAFLYLAFRYTVADRALESAAQRIAASDAPGARAAFTEYKRVRLPGASADLWCARNMLAQSQKGDALHRLQNLMIARAEASEATRNAEDPFNAWYTLGEVSAALNDAPATETSLRRAIAANPTWFKPHWTLARLLRMENRPAEAAAEAGLAVDLDGGKHPEVGQTLSEILAFHR